MKLIHKNGEKVPYFLTGSKLIINGKPHLVGIAIDISARKKAEELLRESEERMTLAAEAAGFGVWMWSIPGNQVWGWSGGCACSGSHPMQPSALKWSCSEFIRTTANGWSARCGAH